VGRCESTLSHAADVLLLLPATSRQVSARKARHKTATAANASGALARLRRASSCSPNPPGQRAGVAELDAQRDLPGPAPRHGGMARPDLRRIHCQNPPGGWSSRHCKAGAGGADAWWPIGWRSRRTQKQAVGGSRGRLSVRSGRLRSPTAAQAAQPSRLAQPLRRHDHDGACGRSPTSQGDGARRQPVSSADIAVLIRASWSTGQHGVWVPGIEASRPAWPSGPPSDGQPFRLRRSLTSPETRWRNFKPSSTAHRPLHRLQLLGLKPQLEVEIGAANFGLGDGPPNQPQRSLWRNARFSPFQ